MEKERNDRLVYLRVKIKSLAEEAKIIRWETHRAKKYRNYQLVDNLTIHRKIIVRSAARQTLLAYGYLRSKKYGAIETKGSLPLLATDIKGIAKMIVKYGPKGNDYYQSEDDLKSAYEAVKSWIAADDKSAVSIAA